jgi:hypothetical protein
MRQLTTYHDGRVVERAGGATHDSILRPKSVQEHGARCMAAVRKSRACARCRNTTEPRSGTVNPLTGEYVALCQSCLDYVRDETGRVRDPRAAARRVVGEAEKRSRLAALAPHYGGARIDRGPYGPRENPAGIPDPRLVAPMFYGR